MVSAGLQIVAMTIIIDPVSAAGHLAINTRQRIDTDRKTNVYCIVYYVHVVYSFSICCVVVSVGSCQRETDYAM